ncbi:putative protein (plasmid) [Methanobacterium congolense]|uniref:DUF3800 domain-containing protein n=1 Tax=Methanobacterium congolense TaxID=118062 RepID=A0A1D3L5L6_9EURY|nr:putative protein [Methanobacterium congolense]
MFLDESGDLGPKGSKYFVIAALAVEDPKKLDRIIKNMRRNKFKKELKGSHEIKANSSSTAVKEYMIKKLNKVPNATIYCIIFNKEHYLSNSKNYMDKNELYDCVAGALAREITLRDNTIIRIDKSKGKQFLRKRFDSYFKKNLNTNNRKVEIYHSESHAWSGLQFADIIAGSYFQKFEHDDGICVDLLDIKCNLHELKRK